jgi:hypothetical protein
MVNKIKNTLKIVFGVLGVIAIFDWIIAPGLTAQNTIVNILSFLLAGFISTIIGVILWNELNNKDSDSDEDDKKEIIEESKEDKDGKIY